MLEQLPVKEALAAQAAAEQWLRSLIRDPSGSRHFVQKTKFEIEANFRAQMARMSGFLDFCGRPQALFNAVHVAGTSGKGSVTAMIAALLAECGLTTGWHVSPYLQICNEKLIVNGRFITPTQFAALVNKFRALYDAWIAQGGDLRYGEAWVALTFLWFAQQQVDWGVVETGMGGRFDPTNVLPAGLAVITNVNYDHVAQLGPALTDIAYQKAGIIKPHGLAVTAVSQPDALAIICTEAKKQQARLFCLDEDFSYVVEEFDTRSISVTVQTPRRVYPHLRISLPGFFQAQNAALAVTAVDLLRENFDLPFSQAAAQKALGTLKFPGRMEVMQTRPLTIIDSAHNPHKIEALAASIRALYPHKQITAVTGSLVTKDYAGSLQTLVALADRLVLTQPDVFGKPAVPPHKLAAMARALDADKPIFTCENVEESLKTAFQHSAAADLVLITGSLYLAGEARSFWFPPGDILRGCF